MRQRIRRETSHRLRFVDAQQRDIVPRPSARSSETRLAVGGRRQSERDTAPCSVDPQYLRRCFATVGPQQRDITDNESRKQSTLEANHGRPRIFRTAAR